MEKRKKAIDKSGVIFRLEPFLVFALAFLLRLLYLHFFVHDPFFSVPLVDAAEHHERALHLLGIRTNPEFEFRAFLRAPGYPYLLAGIWRMTAGRFFTAYFVQFLAGALLSSLLFIIARRYWGRAAGWVSAILFAFYGPQIFFESRLLPPVFAEALLLLAIICLLPFTGKRPSALKGRSLVFISGLAIGLGALLRPNLLAAGAGILIFLLIYKRLRGKAALFVFALVLGVMPATIENYSREGVFVPIAYGDGVNFHLGNGPDHDRLLKLRPGLEWDRIIAEPKGAIAPEKYNAAFHSAYFKRKALAHMITHPVDSALKLSWHFLAFLSPTEVSRDEPVRYHLERWRGKLLLLSFWLPSLLGMFGLVALVFLDNRKGLLFLLPLLSYAAGGAFFFFLTRYRMPVLPLFALGGGFAAHLVLEKRDLLSSRKKIIAVPLLVSAGLAVFALAAPPRYDLDLREGRIASAKIAVTVEQNLAKAHEILSGIPQPDERERFLAEMVGFLQKPSEEAAAKWAKGLIRDQSPPDHRYQAALKLLQYSYFEPGKALLESIMDIAEYTGRAAVRLAELLAFEKRYAPCLEIALKGLDADPNSTGLHAAAAQCSAALKKLDRARRHLEMLLRLEPRKAEHAYHMAFIEHLAGNEAASKKWMERAKALGFKGR